MASNIRVRLLQNRFRAYGRDAKRAYQTALDECIDDLVRTSSETAPHDEGILEKSWSKETVMDGASPVGVVTYAVKKQGGQGKKQGNFNYALKMHEEEYNLGEKSQAKPGGTGMSGKTYSVGPGYLGDVLKGEAETYERHIERSLREFSQNY